jgi:cbb3-type cytochrome oxidase cytochrome c subunit
MLRPDPLDIILCLLAFFFISGCSYDGAELFESKGCSRCHSFKGAGGSMAPDLTAVTQRRSKEWIRRQIRNPKRNDPNSRMPEFSHLTEMEIRAIISFLRD